MSNDASKTREERLAAKLRENLRRRKAQARALGGRESGHSDVDETSVTDENESGGLSKTSPES